MGGFEDWLARFLGPAPRHCGALLQIGANWEGLVSTLWRFVWFDATLARTKKRINALAISNSKLHVYGFNDGVRKSVTLWRSTSATLSAKRRN